MKEKKTDAIAFLNLVKTLSPANQAKLLEEMNKELEEQKRGNK